MTQQERRIYLIGELLKEQPKYREIEIPKNEQDQKQLLRSLMNVRPPYPIGKDFLRVQDTYLQEETARKGQMLGCFCPCHGCIDNAIHTYAGIQLRLACAELMEKQGHEEATGQAKLTPAYNLPCDYVLHTVGPIVSGSVTQNDKKLLASCYRSCLELAEQNGIGSVAFCCISTGEFHFPNEKAAEIAVQTVKEYRRRTNSKIEVIFNVFKQMDYEIYRGFLERASYIG